MILCVLYGCENPLLYRPLLPPLTASIQVCWYNLDQKVKVLLIVASLRIWSVLWTLVQPDLSVFPAARGPWGKKSGANATAGWWHCSTKTRIEAASFFRVFFFFLPHNLLYKAGSERSVGPKDKCDLMQILVLRGCSLTNRVALWVPETIQWKWEGWEHDKSLTVQ